jgi:hypothetical protein
MKGDIIGSLTYVRGQQLLAQGSRSSVYKGKHNGGEVTIQRIEVGVSDIDLRDLSKIGYHHHIAAFICKESDSHFQ